MTEMFGRLKKALIGRYRIEGEIGRGGMATVFLAQDLKHGRRVAVKVLHPDVAASLGADRFLDEIRIAARLTHPNIVPLHDSGSADGLLYYVMPYLEGESLRERLNTQRRLPVTEAVQIAREVADGLACAHRRLVVHRDIKPENILLVEGHAVLVDFGLAQPIHDRDAEPTGDAAWPVGTPTYMSPEQASGNWDVDTRSDLYSLGCVLYEMLAGRPPFEGSNARAVIASHVVEAVPPLSTACPDLPQNVVYAVTKALAKSPDDRFDTIRDFAEALTTPDAQERSDGPSIAVLPFSDVSDSKGHEYLSDGIAEEIILALTRIEGLRVASRAASFAFKDTQRNVRAIGEQLHVRTILEGSVRRAGDRLRITAELINAADGYQLWTRRYDRDIADVFAIQEEIAENIARTLQVILSKGKKSTGTPPTADVTAYDYYLRGKQYLHHGTKKSYEFARQMFERATESDPDFARAHAGIANCCSFLVHLYGDPTDVNIPRADAASREAIRLDPNLADGHAARGFVLWLMDRPDEARRAFEAAIDLDPVLGDARYLYGRACFQQGQLDKAVSLFEEACRIREDYEARYFAAQTYTALGRDADAEEAYRRALRATEHHLTLNPDDARALTMGAVAWCRIGQRAKGLEWAERALAADPEDAGVRYNVACLYSLEGESDKAIACLETAVHAGFAHKEWVDNDPDLDSLRDDPRFKALAWRV